MKAKHVRRWYRLHKWSSLVCTGLLLMSCLTGLPLIFHEEIEHLTEHHIAAAALPVGAPFASLDGIVKEARAKYPGQIITSMGWDDDEPRIFIAMSPTPVPRPDTERTLAFDAHTGHFLEEPKPVHGLLYFLVRLHIDLFAGLKGGVILGTMALTFVLALVTGVLVYGPFMRRLEFGTIRRTDTIRLRWFDLHNLIGIVTVSWALVVGVTGFMSTLSMPLFDLWRAQEMPQLLIPYKGKPAIQRLGSVDGTVAVVHQALPAMQITGVVFPNPKFSTPRHYLVWTKGNTPLTSELFTPVLVDAETGKLIQAHGLPWYLRALEVSRPLHFGDYGGVPLKVVWALFDVALITVLLSGVYLWLSRRKTPVEDELDRLVKLEELTEEVKPAVGAAAQ